MSILSEARKYKLCLTLGNQYIGQMPEDIKSAVFGNVGTLLIGRTGPDDAKFLEQQFEPVFNANDIIGLPNLAFYSKMLCGGQHPPAFSMETGEQHPKFAPESTFKMATFPKLVPVMVNMSRMKYGRDAKIVEDEIMQRGDFRSSESDD